MYRNLVEITQAPQTSGETLFEGNPGLASKAPHKWGFTTEFANHEYIPNDSRTNSKLFVMYAGHKKNLLTISVIFFFVSFCRPHCGQRRGKLLRFTIIYAHYIITSTALVYLHMITSCLAPAHTSRIPQSHLLLAGCHTIFALHLRRITARRSLRQTFQPLTFARLEQKVCLTLI